MGNMGKYFGTDGFRGVANETLTAVHAFRTGRFLGHYNCEKRGGRARIVVGKDTRRSSYMLEYALAAGATASGADVYLLHVTTTPSVSYVARTEKFDCGVMISASHNPFGDNGIKLIGPTGEKLEDSVLRLVEDFLDGGTLPFAVGEKVGRTVDFVAGRNRYLAYLLALPRVSFRGMRVGLDCANGSAWAISKAVFDALGAQVFAIGVEPDGVNVNENCGSTHPERLCAFVRENALDVGFAFDGDADRCICVDEAGKVVDGDGILYLCARALKARGELDGDTVVATVMSNLGLSESLQKHGITCVGTEVGDRSVCEEMARCGAILGGEQSGHIVFRKYAQTGDGILTALKVMETIIESKCPLSCLTEGFVRYPQVRRNVRAENRGEAAARPRVKELVREAEGYGMRAIVRVSGTEPVVRVLVEGAREGACESYAERIARAVRGEEGVCAES